MSTVDPQEQARTRANARVGSRGSLVWLAAVDLILVISAAGFARGLVAFSAVPAEGTDAPPAAVVLGMTVGLPLVIFGLFAHFGALRAYTGKALGRSPFPGIVSLLLAGGALGCWWGWRETESAVLWVPILVTALALLSLVLGLLARNAHHASNRALEELLRTGQIAPATVTKIPELDPHSSGLLAAITVKFTDTEGTERWVTKAGTWLRADVPKVGDPATVVFDPSDPGNQQRIWIGRADATVAADFLT